MTTRYEIPAGLFAGQTVAVLAPGPSLTQALADSVRQYPRIVVRRAFTFAPDADMLVALDGRTDSADGSFWDETSDFRGLRVTGIESDELDALYVHVPHEIVKMSENHTVQIRNSGLAAIRIAAMTGASKILLLGFDPERYESDQAEFIAAGLEAIIAELREQGIEVERVDSVAAEPAAEETGDEFRSWR